MLKQWQIYAPNMTRDNVIEAFITTPYDTNMRHPDMIEGGWVEGAMDASQNDRSDPSQTSRIIEFLSSKICISVPPTCIPGVELLEVQL